MTDVGLAFDSTLRAGGAQPGSFSFTDFANYVGYKTPTTGTQYSGGGNPNYNLNSQITTLDELTPDELTRFKQYAPETLMAQAAALTGAQPATVEEAMLTLANWARQQNQVILSQTQQRFPQNTAEQRISALAESFQRYSIERWGRPLDQATADMYAKEATEGGTTSPQEIYERINNAGRVYWSEGLVPEGMDWRDAISPYMASYEEWTGIIPDMNTEAIQWLRTAPEEERHMAGFRMHVMSQPDYWDTPGGVALERREVMAMAQGFGV